MLKKDFCTYKIAEGTSEILANYTFSVGCWMDFQLQQLQLMGSIFQDPNSQFYSVNLSLSRSSASRFCLSITLDVVQFAVQSLTILSNQLLFSGQTHNLLPQAKFFPATTEFKLHLFKPKQHKTNGETVAFLQF